MAESNSSSVSITASEAQVSDQTFKANQTVQAQQAAKVQTQPQIDNNFNFCPKCGGKKISYIDNRKWGCADCGFKLYNNVAAAVGIIITDKNDNVFFEVRAKEPRKGFLALPGGFCDPDETAEHAALRECKEELDPQIEDVKYLCSFPNVYDYKNIRYKTCDMFFTAKIPHSETLMEQIKLQEKEVAGVTVKSVKSEADIEALPLAFESARKTLKIWLSSRNLAAKNISSEIQEVK